jgi:hypothetical protein
VEGYNQLFKAPDYTSRVNVLEWWVEVADFVFLLAAEF